MIWGCFRFFCKTIWWRKEETERFIKLYPLECKNTKTITQLIILLRFRLRLGICSEHVRSKFSEIISTLSIPVEKSLFSFAIFNSFKSLRFGISGTHFPQHPYIQFLVLHFYQRIHDGGHRLVMLALELAFALHRAAAAPLSTRRYYRRYDSIPVMIPVLISTVAGIPFETPRTYAYSTCATYFCVLHPLACELWLLLLLSKSLTLSLGSSADVKNP